MIDTNDILAKIAAASAEYDSAVLDRHQSLRAAHEFSETKLRELRAELTTSPPPNQLHIHVLATAGSLARMEASGLSDLDLIIATEFSQLGGTASNSTADVISWRDSFCDKLKIDKPNPTGVFQKPVDRSLVESISGAATERYDETAKRILFVLESTWLYNEKEYEKLLDAVIDRYAEDVQIDPRKNFVFLLNDVVRYFRQLCVNYQQVKSETPDGKWPIRNVKLRHSRVLMYFSMVAAIGALSPEHGSNKVSALKVLVRMNPLKRLFVSYKISSDQSFYRVAGFYNTFISLLSNPDVRTQLQELDYDRRYSSDAFAQLKANSDALAAELLRFYEARRGTWDERFFEYMLL